MVSRQNINDQLRNIKFNTHSWNRSETLELANIILPDEKIYECVNGWYEGGVALLVSTNIRVLLIDKKPFKFLSLEDVRFDTINQIDYGRRLLDAHIIISAGMRDLTFRSYNKDRLRKLINHVQHRMAEIKAEQADYSVSQREHLKDINVRLKDYLIAQYEQQESIKRELASRKDLLYNLNDNLTKELPKVNNISDPTVVNYATGINPQELYDITKYQEENLLIIRKNDEIFPLIWALTGKERSVIYEALSSTTTYRISRQKFLNLLNKQPNCLYPLLDMAIEMYRLHSERILTLEYRTVRERLISFLLTTSQRFGVIIQNNQIALNVPLRHQDIASSINASRETTSRELSGLEKKGLIDTKRPYIIIKNLKKIEKYIA